MNSYKKDLFTGIFFLLGIWSFISGEFIFSALLFAGTALFTNIASNPAISVNSI